MRYHLLKGHESEGPFEERDLLEMRAKGLLAESAMVRPESQSHWTPLRRLFPRARAAEPAPAPIAASPEPPPAALVQPEISGESLLKKPSRAVQPLVEAWEWISLNPIVAGVSGVALACALAFLARWPILVALPGVFLGVVAGIFLVTRNRPFAGIAVSLSATLIPLALLPSRPAAKPGNSIAVEEREPPMLAVNSAPAPEPEPGQAVPEPFDAGEQAVANSPAMPALPEPVDPAPAPRSGDLAMPAAESPETALPPIPEKKAVISEAARTAANPNAPRPEDVIFLIDTGTGKGSGFIAEKDNQTHLYTNLHVISGALRIGAKNGGQSFDFRTSDVEVATDRDLVRFPIPAQPGLTFNSSPQIDDKIFALGDSGGHGVVTRLAGEVLGVGPDTIEVSTAFIPGNSGGPIVSDKNEVVGVSTYMIRTENLPEWIKSGSRFNEARRFAVRVTDDVKWIRLPAATLVQQTKSLDLAEELLLEYVGFIRTMSDGLFQQQLTTKFSDRNNIRVFVDSFNREVADNRRGARRKPGADRLREVREHVGRLSRCLDSTAQDLRRRIGGKNQGYLHEREKELLDAFEQLSDALEKDDRNLFNMN